MSEAAGSISAVVARSNINVESDLTVDLFSSDLTEAAVLKTVLYLRGRRSVEFTITLLMIAAGWIAIGKRCVLKPMVISVRCNRLS